MNIQNKNGSINLKTMIVLTILCLALLLSSEVFSTMAYLTDSEQNATELSSSGWKIFQSVIRETFNPPEDVYQHNEYIKTVRAENTGTIDAYPRVFLGFSNNTIEEASKVSCDNGNTWITLTELKANPPTGWEYIPFSTSRLLGDYFYYTSPLNPGDLTTPLITNVRTDFADNTDIQAHNIIVYQEAIPTSHLDCLIAWRNYLDGSTNAGGNEMYSAAADIEDYDLVIRSSESAYQYLYIWDEDTGEELNGNYPGDPIVRVVENGVTYFVYNFPETYFGENVKMILSYFDGTSTQHRTGDIDLPIRTALSCIEIDVPTGDNITTTEYSIRPGKARPQESDFNSYDVIVQVPNGWTDGNSKTYLHLYNENGGYWFAPYPGIDITASRMDIDGNTYFGYNLPKDLKDTHVSINVIRVNSSNETTHKCDNTPIVVTDKTKKYVMSASLNIYEKRSNPPAAVEMARQRVTTSVAPNMTIKIENRCTPHSFAERGCTTFIYECIGSDIYGNEHSYYKTINQNDWVTTTYTSATLNFVVPKGEYQVREIGTSRFPLANITSYKHGSATVNSGTVKSWGRVAGISQATDITFRHNTYAADAFSFNDYVSNRISGRVPVSLNVYYNRGYLSLDHVFTDSEFDYIEVVYSNGDSSLLSVDDVNFDIVQDSNDINQLIVTVEYSEGNELVSDTFTGIYEPFAHQFDLVFRSTQKYSYVKYGNDGQQVVQNSGWIPVTPVKYYDLSGQSYYYYLFNLADYTGTTYYNSGSNLFAMFSNDSTAESSTVYQNFIYQGLNIIYHNNGHIENDDLQIYDVDTGYIGIRPELGGTLVIEDRTGTHSYSDWQNTWSELLLLGSESDVNDIHDNKLFIDWWNNTTASIVSSNGLYNAALDADINYTYTVTGNYDPYIRGASTLKINEWQEYIVDGINYYADSDKENYLLTYGAESTLRPIDTRFGSSAASAGRRIYIDATAVNGSSINVYMWGTLSNPLSWPGVAVQSVGGNYPYVYYYDLDNSDVIDGIVVNGVFNGNSGSQTVDITSNNGYDIPGIDEAVVYVIRNNQDRYGHYYVIPSTYNGQYESGGGGENNEPTNPYTGYNVIFDCSNYTWWEDGANVNIYYWSDSHSDYSLSWPGAQMIQLDTHVYGFNIPAVGGYTIIFNRSDPSSGSSWNQTINISDTPSSNTYFYKLGPRDGSKYTVSVYHDYSSYLNS